MKKGEIYYVRIPHSTGFEIQKNRPAVIVGNDLVDNAGNVLTVVFLTTSDRRPDIRSHVTVRCKGKEATALVEQMTCVDRSRIEGYAGRVSEQELGDIEAAIGWHLGIATEKTAADGTEALRAEKAKLNVERDLLMALVREAMA